MKDFLRVLRFAWPYRVRLILSFFCALMVAVLWGGNLMAIYPILEILDTSHAADAGQGPQRQNLQRWINSEIAQLKVRETRAKNNIAEDEKLLAEATRVDDQGRIRDRLAGRQKELSGIARNLNWCHFGKNIIDKYCPEDPFKTIAMLMGLLVIAVALKGVFDFWQESLVGSAVNLALFDLRNRFYRNVIHLDAGQFSEDGTHELMARFTNDMESLSNGMKILFGKMIAEPLKALSCIAFACWINWRLTLMFLLVVPIALVIMGKVGAYMKRASRRVLESMSSLYKILQETFQGIKVVKAFTMERYERRRFFMGAKDYYRKGMRVVNLDAISGPTMELLGVIAIGGALLAGSYLVLNGKTQLFGIQMAAAADQMNFKALLTLYALLAAIADPVRKLSNVYNRIQSGAAAADRIFVYMDRPPRVRANVGSQRLERHHLGVEFRDICFSYVPEEPILTNIHLKATFGETIALVGKNGCGKSTLVGLLPRFFDPDHGTVFIDGIDVRKVNLRSLRQQIGLVSQDTVLFDDTIYNNIAYGKRHAQVEEVEAAAKKAYAHDFIVKIRDGYQTRIGEMGTALSGGQRQRIALARAILRDPSVLILDEATSAADLESEVLIHKALKEFTKNRTTFIITHRLSTLEIADRIVVIDGGRIDAVGTHQELMKSCGAYQRLHEVQFQRQCA